MTLFQINTNCINKSQKIAVIPLLWLIPVILTITTEANGLIFITTTIAALISIAFIVIQPSNAVVTLPFFTLLSPMTGLMNIGGMKILYSDILFIILIIQVVFLISSSRQSWGRSLNSGHYLLIGLYIISLVIGLITGTLVSLKPMLYLLQLMIVFFYTIKYGLSGDDWLTIMRSWLIATVFASLILLNAYSRGKSLDGLKILEDVPLSDLTDLTKLFRATYYYTGVHYLIGLGIVWLSIRLFFPLGRFYRVVVLFGLAVLVPALIATVNKTAMAAAIIAIFLSAALLFYKFKKEMLPRLRVLGYLGLICLGIATWQYRVLLETTQLELVLNRMSSTGSLNARFDVYEQAIDQWVASPIRTIVGYGPDFLDSSGEPTIATVFKTSKTNGYVEGTVDSGWLSYLFELGLPAFILILVFTWQGIMRVGRCILQAKFFNDDLYLRSSIFAGVIFLTIAMTTQMLGYTKISWLPLQVVTVALFGFRGRQLTNEE